MEQSSAPGEGALPPTPTTPIPAPPPGLLQPQQLLTEFRARSSDQWILCDLRQGWAPHLSRGWEGLRGPTYLDNTFLLGMFFTSRGGFRKDKGLEVSPPSFFPPSLPGM